MNTWFVLQANLIISATSLFSGQIPLKKKKKSVGARARACVHT